MAGRLLAAVAAVGLIACGTGRPERAPASPQPQPVSTAVSPEPKAPADCHVTLAPGADLAAALAEAPAGAMVCLHPGRYPATLVVTRDVVLRGLGGAAAVVLDGGGAGAVVAVHADDVTVRLEGLTLTGGSAPQGGAVALTALSRVELVACMLHHNMGRQGPGGAIYADQGTVVVERCRIAENDASDAPVACVDGIASLLVSDSLLVGAGGATDAVVRVRDGADATLLRSTVVALDQAAALHASGTSSRAPDVTVTDAILAGSRALDVPGPFPGGVTVRRSLLSAAAPGTFVDGGAVRVAAPGFGGSADEPYRPGADSPACGLAEGGTPDLAGQARPAPGACAGAFEPARP